ncbi:hypothetical protein MRX96_029059 [Rhipicephalus microplus]
MSFNDDYGVARDGRKTTATWIVFTREERELLVNLMTRHTAIIENKRTGTDVLAKRAKDIQVEEEVFRGKAKPVSHRGRTIYLPANEPLIGACWSGDITHGGTVPEPEKQQQQRIETQPEQK